ncbi:hypothetical protein EBU99_13970 [bacterium]|nr:hypothetical protein [bacterium]
MSNSNKAEQVNDILSNKGISSSWKVGSDAEAISFVTDVIETECALGDEKWDEAIPLFKRHVKSYTRFMEELQQRNYNSEATE